MALKKFAGNANPIATKVVMMEQSFTQLEFGEYRRDTGVSVTVNIGNDVSEERGAGGGEGLLIDWCSFSSCEVSLAVFK